MNNNKKKKCKKNAEFKTTAADRMYIVHMQIVKGKKHTFLHFMAVNSRPTNLIGLN